MSAARASSTSPRWKPCAWATPIADVVGILGSLDIVLGEVDR